MKNRLLSWSITVVTTLAASLATTLTPIVASAANQSQDALSIPQETFLESTVNGDLETDTQLALHPFFQQQLDDKEGTIQEGPGVGTPVSPTEPVVPSKSPSQGRWIKPAVNGFRWPTKGIITSGFGWRWGRMHQGIDIAGPTGTPIVAAESGKVITAGWNDGGYGNLVRIQHPGGNVTVYGHNSRILVRVGQQVQQGQPIAAMGSTGRSTGPHCHFEIHLARKGAVNPIAYLPRK